MIIWNVLQHTNKKCSKKCCVHFFYFIYAVDDVKMSKMTHQCNPYLTFICLLYHLPFMWFSITSCKKQIYEDIIVTSYSFYLIEKIKQTLSLFYRVVQNLRDSFFFFYIHDCCVLILNKTSFSFSVSSFKNYNYLPKKIF